MVVVVSIVIIADGIHAKASQRSSVNQCDRFNIIIIIIIINNNNIYIYILIIIPRRCIWYCHRDKVTARVHPVVLTNVGQRQATAAPQTKPTWAVSSHACRLLSPKSPSPMSENAEST